MQVCIHEILFLHLHITFNRGGNSTIQRKIMKAIKTKLGVYKLIEERGDFFIVEKNGKKTFLRKSESELIEVDEIKEKTPKYRKSSNFKSKNNYSEIDGYISIVKAVLNDTCSGRVIYAAIDNSDAEMPEMVKSILNQANYKSGYISDKQVLVLAKFLSDNNIRVNTNF